MNQALADPIKLGVLASHEGTTLQAILDACASGRIAGRVSIVISNNSDAGALRRARAAGVATLHLSSKTHPSPELVDGAMCSALREAGCSVVMLAGYMKKLGPITLSEFAGRILNTHPALLPKFGGHGMYGLRVHEAVLAAGERESGASVHLVDAGYDTGRVIARCSVPVAPADTAETLAARVQAGERALVIDVLARIASGELRLEA
jgi:phosphoribosylglycinamide formyltransferase-1